MAFGKSLISAFVDTRDKDTFCLSVLKQLKSCFNSICAAGKDNNDIYLVCGRMAIQYDIKINPLCNYNTYRNTGKSYDKINNFLLQNIQISKIILAMRLVL